MNTSRFLEGFLIGGLIGAAVALIMAPAPGDEIRGRFQGQFDRVRSEVNKAVSQRRAELEQQLSDLRAPQH
jgi:gas vesicle protein